MPFISHQGYNRVQRIIILGKLPVLHQLIRVQLIPGQHKLQSSRRERPLYHTAILNIYQTAIVAIHSVEMRGTVIRIAWKTDIQTPDPLLFSPPPEYVQTACARYRPKQNMRIQCLRFSPLPQLFSSPILIDSQRVPDSGTVPIGAVLSTVLGQSRA